MAYDDSGIFDGASLHSTDYVMAPAEVMTKPKMLLANLFDDQDGNLISEGEFTIDMAALALCN